MRQILKLPPLLNGTPQSSLAGILPLSSLIELIDVETKLHCYELSGSGIVWNWPITPAGARLMFARCRAKEARNPMGCLLDDGGERSPPLQCVDMCYGDVYPCISSFTVRACAEVAPLVKVVQPSEDVSYRLQRLEVVHVYQDTADSQKTRALPDLRWLAVLLIGWAAWTAAVVISVICAMPLALAYLLILPATGLCMRYTFGHRPRPLLVKPPGKDGHCWRRCVIVANHFNEVEWSVYIGDFRLINALLNKPFLRPPHKTPIPSLLRNHTIAKYLLHFLVAGQWGLVLAVSALQNWDAIFVSAALIVCACTSTFLFRTSDIICSWLKYNQLGLEKMSVTFSGRRAMLSALVALNPECRPTEDLVTQWVDPILKRAPSRDDWEQLVQKRLSRNLPLSADKDTPWLVEVIEEGVQKASDINKWLLECERQHNVPPRPPSQFLFIANTPSVPL